jgi:hypothetical protein
LGQSLASSKLSAASPQAGNDPVPVDVTLLGSTKLSVIFSRLSPVTPEKTPSSPAQLTLDDLLAQGVPHQEVLSDVQANRTSPASLSITVDILHNADISIVDQNIVPISEAELDPSIAIESTETDTDANGNDSSNAKRKIRTLEKALDVCGDLDLWVEWVRTKNR